jgi:exodeoxyribonuclease V
MKSISWNKENNLTVALTAEQQKVFDACERFIRSNTFGREKRHFVFDGPAGAGKSVVMAALARKYPSAMLCAFTGKAASVLARKSGLETGTVHGAIYKFTGLHAETNEPKFWPKLGDGDWRGKLVFIDECFTVDQWLGRDLMATGCKVVACGDGNQLRPVKGSRFFDRSDMSLIEIHRQAWDSAIIRQAHRVRTEGVYEADGPDFRVVGGGRALSHDDIAASDIVLCWKNATRIEINRHVRTHKGFSGWIRRGEPVMCLKNDKKMGVLNGAVYVLLEDQKPLSGRIVIENERGEVVAMKKSWIEGVEGDWEADDSVGFALGYCATIHKAQGSEWDRVILVDEYDRVDQRREWIYTGISRSAKSIIIQRNR